MTRSTPVTLVLVLAAIVFLSFGAYGLVGLVDTVPASGDITSETNTGFEVTFEGLTEYPEEPFVDNETVQAQNGTLASPGAANVSLPGGLEASGNLTITTTDATPRVTVRTTDKKTVSFRGNLQSVTLLENTTANDGRADLEFDTTIGPDATDITVEGLAAGESFVLRDVATNEVVGVGTADSNGTVQFDQLETGSHRVEIENFVIEVRDVKTGDLVNNVTVEIRLFQEGTDRVFVQNSSTGIVSTGALPADSAFAITASADGFVERQTFIEDPRQQSNVFLLNDSATTQISRFVVEDRTGDFQSDVRIQVERAIDTPDSPAGEERYRIVAGDIVGSQLEFETTLERNVRYRISVANGVGQVRQLGSFTIKRDKILNLVISGINVGFTQEEDTVQTNVTQSVNETSADKTVRAVVQDPQNETSDVTVEVVPFSNESNVLSSGSTEGPVGTFSWQTTITGDDADKRLLAKITYEREGQTVTRTVPFGSDSFQLLPGLASEWAQIFGVGFLLVLGGVFSVGNARIGAVLIPGAALVLTLGGVLNTVIAPAAVGLAFALAVGINIVNSSEGIFR